ncbi:basic region leucine zipper [Teladorsagia circumcincta]|uniref:Basic region leucine zipper n=1 Tax=Teladorsagia circumcincta TaxID=45464 RepID=A0A2G9TBQ1_TELCI|nr:basic region leucine zipper [Teladorsagia circumcincta]
MDDLVDIVLLAADNVSKSKSGNSIKREYNKRAAIRYREKRKERWLNLQKEQAELERTNAKLEESIAFLTNEVAEFRRKIFAFLPHQNTDN